MQIESDERNAAVPLGKLNPIGSIDLKEIPLFRGLSPEEIRIFVEGTSSTLRRYGKSDRVLRPYERNPNIGVMVEGIAQVIAEDRFGNESVGHGLERGSLLGSTSAILSEEYSPTAIEALSEVMVLWIPYQSLLVAGPRLGRIHGIVMKNLLEAFASKNVLMIEKLNLLSQKSIRERIIIYLLQRERHQRREDVRVPGRVQLAKELECHRSALTREISRMESEGLLECGEGWMRLEKGRL